MNETAPVAFTGAEVAVITGMLAVLGGVISVLWFAYSQSMTRRIEAELERNHMVRQIAVDALSLFNTIVARTNGHLMTKEEHEEYLALRGRLREQVPSENLPRERRPR